MKSIKRISIMLALLLCLVVAFAACRDEDGFVYVTDEAGEIVTDTDGAPVTALDTDGDGQPDDSQTDTGKFEKAGVNTEDVWGDIVTPNR